jgi:hypothetical protein
MIMMVVVVTVGVKYKGGQYGGESLGRGRGKGRVLGVNRINMCYSLYICV